MSELGVSRPFPGLRSYAAPDSGWFFGREAQTSAVYLLLTRGRFVAVVGGSGTGKSSLVRAGLLPVLDEENAGEGHRLWWWREMRPGDAPIARLAEALVDSIASDAPEEESRMLSARRQRVDFLLRASPFGLLDALDELGALTDADDERTPSPVLLVDQFEEIFRFADLPGTAALRAERREEAASFVALLLEACRSTEHAVRVIITMRSDYIGDCARFYTLPETISGSQYLVPMLTRAQRADVIRMPIEKSGAIINNELVEKLLHDSIDEVDQLPLLQHIMMRIWQQCDSGSHPLTLSAYEAVGGWQGALAAHAEDVLDEPDLQNDRQTVEQVFRALTELDRQNRGTRRPLAFSQLVAETGIPAESVRLVVDRFRAEDCSFLVPPSSARKLLSVGDIVDIGHEALIRRWNRLGELPRPNVSTADRQAQQGWVYSEAEDGRIYRALTTLAEAADIGARNFLPLDQVRERSEWWHSRPRTPAWAERYGGRFALIEELLNESCRRLEERKLKELRDSQEKVSRERERLEFAQKTAALERARSEALEKTADLERSRADEKQKEVARTKKLLFIAAALAIVAIGAFGLTVYKTIQLERSNNQLFASSIWTRISPGFLPNSNEVDALWDLKGASGERKAAFLAQLSGDNERRFQRRGPEILRSLGHLNNETAIELLTEHALPLAYGRSTIWQAPGLIKSILASLSDQQIRKVFDQHVQLANSAVEPRRLAQLMQQVGELASRLPESDAALPLKSLISRAANILILSDVENQKDTAVNLGRGIAALEESLHGYSSPFPDLAYPSAALAVITNLYDRNDDWFYDMTLLPTIAALAGLSNRADAELARAALEKGLSKATEPMERMNIMLAQADFLPLVEAETAERLSSDMARNVATIVQNGSNLFVLAKVPQLLDKMLPSLRPEAAELILTSCKDTRQKDLSSEVRAVLLQIAGMMVEKVGRNTLDAIGRSNGKGLPHILRLAAAIRLEEGHMGVCGELSELKSGIANESSPILSKQWARLIARCVAGAEEGTLARELAEILQYPTVAGEPDEVFVVVAQSKWPVMGPRKSTGADVLAWLQTKSRFGPGLAATVTRPVPLPALSNGAQADGTAANP